MNEAALHTDALRSELNEEVEALKELTLVLQAEQTALVELDLEAIEGLATKKEELVGRLAALTLARKNVMDQLKATHPALSSMAADPSPGELARALGEDDLTDSLRKIKSLAVSIGELNSINRSLVSGSLVHLRQAMSILGISSSPGLYNMRGGIDESGGTGVMVRETI